MKIFTSVADVDPSEWDKLMENSPYANFFQSRHCYDFFSKVGCFEPFVVGISGNGSVRGIITGYIQSDGGRLKRYMSRRAIINAGPLLAPDISDGELLELLHSCGKFLKHKAIYVETRNFFDYSRYKAIFEKAGFTYKEHLNFQIDTTSEETAMQNMGKSRKRDIKVTLRDGASIVENPTDNEVEQYYSILSDLYRTKVKTPLFPVDFFVELNRNTFGKLLLVKYNEKIVGGTVCVGLPGTPLYEWFACGEDGVYKNIHASTSATFGGIRYACTNGYPKLDMMGAGTPKDNYGVRDFKAKFGGELVENGRFVRVFNRPLFDLGKLAVKILKKI